MELCNTLREYSLFVDAARRYTTMAKEEGIDEYTRKGVRKAVDYCIENGILAEICSISIEVEDASNIDEICNVYMKEIENV